MRGDFSDGTVAAAIPQAVSPRATEMGAVEKVGG
jgi:hypothetical protein